MTPVTRTNAAAATTVTARLARAARNAGRYTRSAACTSTFSFSDMRPVMKIASAAGTKVNVRIMAPASAASTVNAIGKNIFPSMPVRVRIGR